jgi:membrane protease YdiL (CAAX protease family)
VAIDFRDLLINLFAFGLVALAGGLVSLLLWVFVLKGQGRLLPLQRFRRGTWGGREVALVFLLILLVPGLTHGFLQEIGFYEKYYGQDPTSGQKQLWYMALAFPITVAGTFLILYTLSGTRPRHLGLSAARLPQNLILGWLAWFPLTILTLGLYALVRLWITAKEHPLSLLEKQAGIPEWLLGIFLAVVIAPFLEELVFRGVLLGWLQRCSLVGHGVVAACAFLVGSLPLAEHLLQTSEKPVEPNLGPMVFALVLVAGYFGVVPLGQTGSDLTTTLPEPIGSSHEDKRNFRKASALAAIYGSSMLFAVFHSSVWPTPIPLFILGLGLGWLASRTQNLVSSITVHFLFNSVACLVLALSLIFG